MPFDNIRNSLEKDELIKEQRVNQLLEEERQRALLKAPVHSMREDQMQRSPASIPTQEELEQDERNKQQRVDDLLKSQYERFQNLKNKIN